VILRLIRKDLLLNWTIVALVAAGIVTLVAILYLGVGTTRDGGPPVAVVLFITTWFGSLLPAAFAGRDDRYRTGSFDLCLPVTRGQVVLARYLLPLLLLPVWVGLVAGARWACGGLRFPVQVVRPDSLLLALSALVTGMGIVFPLVVWVGFMGLLYGLVGLQVLGLLTAVAVSQFPAVLAALSLLGRIDPMLGGFRAGLGDSWFLMAATGALLFLYALSFAAACALYRHRDA
jgi:hypothetical protein